VLRHVICVEAISSLIMINFLTPLLKLNALKVEKLSVIAFNRGMTFC
jgi:hypothetical protein